MHPGEHFVGLANLYELISFGHGIGLIFEGRPGDWVNHLVDGHWALVLDFRHVVHLHRLIPKWLTRGLRWRLRGLESVEGPSVRRRYRRGGRGEEGE